MNVNVDHCAMAITGEEEESEMGVLLALLESGSLFLLVRWQLETLLLPVSPSLSTLLEADLLSRFDPNTKARTMERRERWRFCSYLGALIVFSWLSINLCLSLTSRSLLCVFISSLVLLGGGGNESGDVLLKVSVLMCSWAQFLGFMGGVSICLIRSWFRYFMNQGDVLEHISIVFAYSWILVRHRLDTLLTEPSSLLQSIALYIVFGVGLDMIALDTHRGKQRRGGKSEVVATLRFDKKTLKILEHDRILLDILEIQEPLVGLHLHERLHTNSLEELCRIIKNGRGPSQLICRMLIGNMKDRGYKWFSFSLEPSCEIATLKRADVEMELALRYAGTYVRASNPAWTSAQEIRAKHKSLEESFSLPSSSGISKDFILKHSVVINENEILCLCSGKPLYSCWFCNEIGSHSMLGIGESNAVFKARWQNHLIACKRTTKVKAMSKTHEQAFWNEVVVLSILRHPNIIRFYGASPQYSIAMELAQMSLTDYIVGHRIIEYTKMVYPKHLKIAQDVATALEYIHSRNFIHGDTKSPNVFVSVSLGSDGKEEVVIAKLGDFGQARFDDTELLLSPVTGLGSIAWSSPERIAGGGPTRESDVYSYGIILWELITCFLPYDAPHFTGTHEELAIKIVSEDFRPQTKGLEPLFRGFRLPVSLVALMEQCWHRSPSNRPTMRDVLSVVLDAKHYWKCSMCGYLNPSLQGKCSNCACSITSIGTSLSYVKELKHNHYAPTTNLLACQNQNGKPLSSLGDLISLSNIRSSSGRGKDVAFVSDRDVPFSQDSPQQKLEDSDTWEDKDPITTDAEDLEQSPPPSITPGPGDEWQKRGGLMKSESETEKNLIRGWECDLCGHENPLDSMECQECHSARVVD